MTDKSKTDKSEKVCRTCGKSKSLTDFYPIRRGQPGVRNNCKICHQANSTVSKRRTRLKSLKALSEGHGLELVLGALPKEKSAQESLLAPLQDAEWLARHIAAIAPVIAEDLISGEVIRISTNGNILIVTREDRPDSADLPPHTLLTEEQKKKNPSILPGYHPDHICGLYCDGQDGNGICASERSYAKVMTMEARREGKLTLEELGTIYGWCRW